MPIARGAGVTAAWGMIRTVALAFLAGFLATILFHQTAIWLLTLLAPFPFAPWNMAPNDYGLPRVVVLSIWAGVWAVPLCLLIRARPRLPAMTTGAVLGSLIPSLWGWTVIAALRGGPLFAGGNGRVILTVLFVNAVWGATTVWLFSLLGGRRTG